MMRANRTRYMQVAAWIFGAMLGLAASHVLAQNADEAITAAFENPDRFPGDADEDARRKAREVLAFAGARPGMQALDYFAGGGYNSELLARIAGPGGSVIAYNSPAHIKRSGEKLAKRFGENRLANVKQLIANPNELQLEASSLDIALFVMAYHDLYHAPKDAAMPGANVALITASLFQAMKPGSVAVVVDHVAGAGGSAVEIADRLHRIDPQQVRDDFTKAGFTFDGESAVLRNTTDDHSKPVFDPAVRYKTDQFIYRFRKPE